VDKERRTVPVRIQIAPGRFVDTDLTLSAADVAALSHDYGVQGPTSFSDLVRSPSSSSSLSDNLSSLGELREELASGGLDMADISVDVEIDQAAELAGIKLRKKGLLMVRLIEPRSRSLKQT
jgi:hypothetical protein